MDQTQRKSGTPPRRDVRGARKTSVGVVVTAKMNKTRRVEVPRLVKHPKYGKYLRRRTVCFVHDEKNESEVGDTVEIMETRPLSRLKRWRLVKVVRVAAHGPEMTEELKEGTV